MFTIDSIGRIARISLDRPQSRNAISLSHWKALSAAIAEVGASDARVLIIRSMAPNIFSSGADIGDLETLGADPAARTTFRTEMAAAFDALTDLSDCQKELKSYLKKRSKQHDPARNFV